MQALCPEARSSSKMIERAPPGGNLPARFVPAAAGCQLFSIRGRFERLYFGGFSVLNPSPMFG
jgi:hypothetical protein